MPSRARLTLPSTVLTHPGLAASQLPGPPPVTRWRCSQPPAATPTLPLRGINNFDVSLSKRFSFGESKAVEFRAAFYNALNHPQLTPGSLNSVRAVASNITRNNLIPAHRAFDRPDQVHDSHAREIHPALRFTFQRDDSSPNG